jgi:hypothetical protein
MWKCKSLFGPALRAGILLLSVSTMPSLAHEAVIIPRTTAPAVTDVALPPLPPGVVDLVFKDFFKDPVGPRGLELTDTLRHLDGRRVRLTGYMVQEHHVTRPGRFILTPQAVQLDEEEFGLCDDLPASATLVIVPSAGANPVPHQPGRVFVVGTLSLGSREEKDGHVFLVRLTLDQAPAVDARAVPAAANK